jgi:hypothetical protein
VAIWLTVGSRWLTRIETIHRYATDRTRYPSICSSIFMPPHARHDGALERRFIGTLLAM